MGGRICQMPVCISIAAILPIDARSESSRSVGTGISRSMVARLGYLPISKQLFCKHSHCAVVYPWVGNRGGDLIVSVLTMAWVGAFDSSGVAVGKTMYCDGVIVISTVMLKIVVKVFSSNMFHVHHQHQPIPLRNCESVFAAPRRTATLLMLIPSHPSPAYPLLNPAPSKSPHEPMTPDTYCTQTHPPTPAHGNALPSAPRAPQT
jgi:hypothetical protein